MLRTALLLFLIASAATAPPGHVLRIDPGHSWAVFGVRVLWLYTVEGRFARVDGQIRVDRRGMAEVDARIDVNRVAMSSERMRRWAWGPEFFDGARFPLIRFRSTPVPLSVLAHGGILDGTLTLRGLTHPIHFTVAPSGCDPGAAAACLILAQGTLSRVDYGMSARRPALADTVALSLGITVYGQLSGR